MVDCSPGRRPMALASRRVAEAGLEWIAVTDLSEMACVKPAFPGGAKSGAQRETDPRFNEILAALPNLPDAALDLIVQTIRAFQR